MPPSPSPWSPSTQYLSTVLDGPPIASHSAPGAQPANTTPTQAATGSTAQGTNTPPRPRPSGQTPHAHSSAQDHGSATAHAQAQAQSHSAFSAAQRSAQARAKPFDNSSHSSTQPAYSRAAPSHSHFHTDPESFAQRERRLEAASILDSTELLLWYAGARNESVAQTRQFYTDVVLGVAGSGAAGEAGAAGEVLGREKVWREEWEGRTGRASPMGKGKGKGKGKEREREREREREKGLSGKRGLYAEG